MTERIIPKNLISNITWYKDLNAKEKGEPGIVHSFLKSLATTLSCIDCSFNPIWLMGSSAFAFRIFINEIMCPSAMSVFDWKSILPEAVEQSGFRCKYISRVWHEAEKEQERKEEAHQAILDAIDSGIPPIVWDISDCEWGLIIGYDTQNKIYQTLTHQGNNSVLKFQNLGRNGIDVLSVTIPQGPNQRTRDDIIRKALQSAVAHSQQKEWMDRPKYQDGLPAYDLWMLILQRWSILIKAGKTDKINIDILDFADYYARHYYSARCYARDFLNLISDGNSHLHEAQALYTKVASNLKYVYEYFCKHNQPDTKILLSLEQKIKDAKIAESKGISKIKDYLST